MDYVETQKHKAPTQTNPLNKLFLTQKFWKIELIENLNFSLKIREIFKILI